MFLDANASMPALPAAKQALIQSLDVIGNPSSPHFLGRKARGFLDEAREQVAKALGAHAKEIFFHSGASEGNRFFVDSVIKMGQERGKPLQVLSSPLEHPSLYKPLKSAHAKGLIDLHWLSFSVQGDILIDEKSLKNAEVFFCIAAHHETGLITPFETLIPYLSEDCMVISDATQAMGRLKPLSQRIDGLVTSAHKMGGIAGCGANMLRNRALRLPAPWTGGGQENNLRPGTQSLPLIIAFGAAAACIEETRHAHESLLPLRTQIETILKEALPEAFIVCDQKPRLPNTLAICLNTKEPEALRMALDMASFCVGFGSACSSLAIEPNPNLIALGLSPSQIRSTMRLSLYPSLEPQAVLEEIKRMVIILKTFTS